MAGAAVPQVTEPSTKLQFGITSPNSSAYSQLPGVAKSHLIVVFPVATTTKRRLNIIPLKATGDRLNHAALNWRRLLAVKGGFGFRELKRPQLLRKPAEIFELIFVTALIHLNLVVS